VKTVRDKVVRHLPVFANYSCKNDWWGTSS